MQTINHISEEVHDLAWEKGWHHIEETEDAFIERTCNNIHDEISELHTAWRDNKLHALCDKADDMIIHDINPLTCLEEEMADIIIRVLDSCKKLNVDINSAIIRKHLYNKTRLHRHGGKKS